MISQTNTNQLKSPSRRLDLKNLDKFIKITEAARILDYASIISVKKLAEDGMLTLYSLPETSLPSNLAERTLKIKVQANGHKIIIPSTDW